MSAEDVTNLLVRMRIKGIKIWAENGQIYYRAPKGALSSKEIDILRSRKEEFLMLLQNSQRIHTSERLGPRSPSEQVPLSFSQQHWRNFWNLDERPSTRSVAAGVRLNGSVDTDAMCDSFGQLVDRHESLRTSLVFIDGHAQQQIHGSSRYNLEIIDLTTLPRASREAEARILASQLANDPVFLSRGPLFAARLVRLDRFEHILVITTEHAISDAASIGIAWRDIFVLYAQTAHKLPCTLPKIAAQFGDYALWQRQTHQVWIEEHGAYWQRRLAKAHRVGTFTDKAVTPPERSKWEILPIRFGDNLTKELVHASRREHTSLVMCVLTLFVALLLRWYGTAAVTVPFTTAGRTHPEVENTIGFFGTPIFLHIELFADDTFEDLLQRVTLEYTTAYAHDDSSRIMVLMDAPDFIFNPSFNWIPRRFNMNPSNDNRELLPGNSIKISQYDFDIAQRDDQEWNGEPRLDLSDSENGVQGTIGYRADRITANAIETFRAHLISLAHVLAREPTTRIAALRFGR
jgi:hypothetical protein